MNKCLYCYEPLSNGEVDFHTKCSRKIFRTLRPPQLPYSRRDLQHLAEQVIRSQTTLTGVQPKLSLDFDHLSRAPKRFTIVGLWGRFILKPQTEYYRCLPELEDLTMHMAELAHIETVPHSLIRFEDGELCYITRRIDRTDNGEKLPMEDMCQLTERLTEDKYKGSHERIATAIELYSSAPKLDLIKYWEQVIFSWIVGNADMHLKNFSLYTTDNQTYQLTPAYDLLSTALVMPEDTEELALSVCGQKRKISPANFIEAMSKSKLDAKDFYRIVKQFKRIAPKWVECIHKSFLDAEMQEEYIKIIEAHLDELGTPQDKL